MKSQSRCHFICKTEIVWFVFYSEHYFASVTCGSFHLNQTSKYVLANKGIELNIVFSLKADALIFFICEYWTLWGLEQQEGLVLQFEFLLSQSSNIKRNMNKTTWKQHLSPFKYSELVRIHFEVNSRMIVYCMYHFIFYQMPSKVKKKKKKTLVLECNWCSFSTLNSFDIVLSLVHALLTDVTASQVECKV